MKVDRDSPGDALPSTLPDHPQATPTPKLPLVDIGTSPHLVEFGKAATPHPQNPTPSDFHLRVPALNIPACDIPESSTVNVVPAEPLTITEERPAVREHYVIFLNIFSVLTQLLLGNYTRRIFNPKHPLMERS
jgi:hypothetical protein